MLAIGFPAVVLGSLRVACQLYLNSGEFVTIDEEACKSSCTTLSSRIYNVQSILTRCVFASGPKKRTESGCAVQSGSRL